MFKFIHAADIHLDSPLLGLDRYEDAPVEEIRGATRRAFANLVQLVMDEQADFMLIAGDLYDGDWKDASTGLYFVKQMAKLREAGIPVFVVMGNHDAANKMTRELRFPGNVTVLSHKKPQTKILEDIGVAIHGQSFAAGDVRDDLASKYPAPVRDAFNIGLLHTCGPGIEGYEPYAPCSLNTFEQKGYDYWALGHVHTRQDLSRDLPVVFPGNLQGRHIREDGPRGCLVVQVDDSHRISKAFVALDVVRWLRCDLDATGATGLEPLIDRFAAKLPGMMSANEGRTLAIRVRIEGQCPADEMLRARRSSFLEKLQSVSVDLGNGSVWVEKLVIDSRPEKGPAIPEGPAAELKAYLDELRSSDEGMKALVQELAGLREVVPADLRERTSDFGLSDPAEMRRILDDVESVLMDRLMNGGEER